MKILLAHNRYARPSGEEHACASIATLLQERGHEVEWLERDSATLLGSRRRQLQAFFSGFYSVAAARELRARVRHQRPDVLHAQNLYPLLSPSILRAARRLDVPVVLRCPNYRLFCPTGLHYTSGAICERCLSPGREMWCAVRNCTGSRGKSISYAMRGLTARWTRMILRHVDVFVVLSDFQRQRFVARGVPAARIAVVPNAIPEVGGAAGDPSAVGRTVAFLGRVSEEKGVGDFLAAARALPQLPFAVAGAVRDDPATQALIANAPQNVRVCGYLQGAALDAFVREARILVCCSRWFEGFPNALARGMAAAKAVVAPRLGCLPEIVTNGVTGVLYEPGSSEALGRAIADLYPRASQCQVLGAAAREDAIRRFGPETVYEQWLAVYAMARDGGECAPASPTTTGAAATVR
ncbi:MAG: glycosyltransferase family 4 protein [Planctomycetota bacterium]